MTDTPLGFGVAAKSTVSGIFKINKIFNLFKKSQGYGSNYYFHF